MPVYGQPTVFHERLVSLMSSVLCNSNDLYDGMTITTNDRPGAKAAANASSGVRVTPPGVRDHRPVFAEAILRKASRLAELEEPGRPRGGGGGGQHRRRRRRLRILEVVLVADPEDASESNILADLIANLASIPDDGVREVRLEVSTVRSHAMR